MPTTAQNTYSATRLDPVMNPDDAKASMIDVKIAASLTLAAGTVLGQVTADSTYKAYASGNSDGSQAPQLILAYGVTTDSSGNITNASEWGQLPNANTVPCYTQGAFLVSELTGLDANAITKLSGHTIGQSTSQIFVF